MNRDTGLLKLHNNLLSPQRSDIYHWTGIYPSGILCPIVCNPWRKYATGDNNHNQRQHHTTKLQKVQSETIPPELKRRRVNISLSPHWHKVGKELARK